MRLACVKELLRLSHEADIDVQDEVCSPRAALLCAGRCRVCSGSWLGPFDTYTHLKLGRRGIRCSTTPS
jgi:hypothetical protein